MSLLLHLVRPRFGALATGQATGQGMPPGSLAGSLGIGPPLLLSDWSSRFLRVTSDFGKRDVQTSVHRSKWHGGLDLAMPPGTPVRAPRDGWAQPVKNSLCGWGVIVWFRDIGWRIGFCHLSRIDIPEGGREIRRGELLGLSGGAKGSSGSGSSTGPHLHITLRRLDGEEWSAVDPAPYIDWGPFDLVYKYREEDPRGRGYYARLFRPTEPDGPRDVPGEGGYVYRQWPDGSISIISVPAGKPSVSGVFLPGTPINEAITAEIGPYQPYAWHHAYSPSTTASPLPAVITSGPSTGAVPLVGWLVAGVVAAGAAVAWKRTIDEALAGRD